MGSWRRMILTIEGIFIGWGLRRYDDFCFVLGVGNLKEQYNRNLWFTTLVKNPVCSLLSYNSG
jgi:hypothetical protein